MKFFSLSRLIWPEGIKPRKLWLSPVGLDHLKTWERCRLQAYDDGYGFLTIGWGHKLTHSELTSGKITLGQRRIRWRDGLNQEQADQLLDKDADWAERCVREHTTTRLRQGQFDALVSFVFNTGCEAYRTSTLHKRLNAGRLDDVPEQLRRWRFSAGRESAGLARRREAEIELWESTV